jgi:uncharacterized YccA/Bax inhibitor family protein
MSFWQRCFIVLAVVVLVSVLFGFAWQSVFGSAIPGYAAGMVGGLTVVVLWDLLKKVKPKK